MKHPDAADSVWLNDVHSSLNLTRVAACESPRDAGDVARRVLESAQRGLPIIASGARHAMGGQQFVTDGVVIDMRSLDRVISFDPDRGLIRAGAGIQWPALLRSYGRLQEGEPAAWGIAQKQTGADMLTLGGSLSANVHGRGLAMQPIVRDVEAFTLVTSNGEILTCSRHENCELFGLVIGGYGLFGIIADVTLRLVRRRPIQRIVKVTESDGLHQQFEQRIAGGFLYGDFQFSIDEGSPGFLRRGIFSCYRPVESADATPKSGSLEEARWLDLLRLAYTDRAEAFARYSEYYLSTNERIYWSDTHQLGPYLPDYAQRIQELSADAKRESLTITELYVPRDRLHDFLQDAIVTLRKRRTIVIYGTVRIIQQDTETFLPWARRNYACVIFNLLVEHTASGLAQASGSFGELIDLADSRGGSFFLTYHRFATRRQVEKCHPSFREFLAAKLRHDPGEIFQSDWYRHYRSADTKP